LIAARINAMGALEDFGVVDRVEEGLGIPSVGFGTTRLALFWSGRTTNFLADSNTAAG
jgi:hypothetical protein